MNQETEQKIYAPMSAKQITFQSSGKTIIKLGINVAKFKAWLDQHVNDKGYVNMGISARKETSQYGETHTCWLDTWKPEAQRSEPRNVKAAPATKEQGDDVPF